MEFLLGDLMFIFEHEITQFAYSFQQSLFVTTCMEPGAVVSVGTGRIIKGFERGQNDSGKHWVQRLPLVSRDGTRVL